MVYERAIRELTDNLTERQLAEQILTYRELVNMYKKDNDVLRQANESLMYLIAKYNIEME
jgi:hypothetical protein